MASQPEQSPSAESIEDKVVLCLISDGDQVCLQSEGWWDITVITETQTDLLHHTSNLSLLPGHLALHGAVAAVLVFLPALRADGYFILLYLVPVIILLINYNDKCP